MNPVKLRCQFFQIALENPEIEREMLVAVEEVMKTGQAMSSAAREFANDPCSSVKRGNMVGPSIF
jgi:catenin alpha